MVNGIFEKADIVKKGNLLPLAFANCVTLKADICIGNLITWDMIDNLEDSYLLKIRKEQDAFVWR
ncbi:MAG: hypothetical protein CMI18_00045 [Opitutaceae bacterium]|nr:hypothetical protein [Opitutaceae bacterium]|tara:strand:+ start:1524 stop:1718 length:195 start_codon:yes stop_codon:yes gene_type:complete